MKLMVIISLILCGFLGCSKDSVTTMVALELRHNQSLTNVEWDNTSGSYVEQGGRLMIHAECSNGEIFKLVLENISDTGRIDKLKIQQIYFAVDGEFTPSLVQNAILHIDKFNSSNINGNFKATLTDDLVEKKIEGKFVMHLGK